MSVIGASPQPQIIQGTRCYVFEETSAVPSAGTVDPGSVNFTLEILHLAMISTRTEDGFNSSGWFRICRQEHTNSLSQ
jgi:hypothetical protein